MRDYSGFRLIRNFKNVNMSPQIHFIHTNIVKIYEKFIDFRLH